MCKQINPDLIDSVLKAFGPLNSEEAALLSFSVMDAILDQLPENSELTRILETSYNELQRFIKDNYQINY